MMSIWAHEGARETPDCELTVVRVGCTFLRHLALHQRPRKSPLGETSSNNGHQSGYRPYLTISP